MGGFPDLINVTNQRSSYIPITSWDFPDSAVTPERMYMRRREFLRLFGFGVAATVVLPASLAAASFPESLNPEYKLNGVKLTPEDLVTSYNNFYEWGTSKDQPKDQANRGWKTESWTIEIAGLCASARKLLVDELIQLVGGIGGGITDTAVSKLGRW